MLHVEDKNKEVAASSVPAFGMKDKIGYMFGDLGNCFILGLVNSFLMIYYTNVLGIAGGIVGVLFLISRIVDAVADVTVGRLSDLSPLTKEGRFSPWIRRMKYPFTLACVVLFLPFVQNFPDTLKIVYIFVSYIVYGIFLSTINIPYGSMASAISSDPSDRGSLSTYRSVGSAIGGSTTGFLIPILMYTTLDNGDRVISGMHFFWIAIGCAAIAFIAYILTCKLTTERVRVEKKEEASTKQLLQGLSKNRALVVLVIVDLFIVINQILAGTNLTYLFNDYFQNEKAMSVALLFNYGTVIVLAPFAKRLTERFGKKEASVCALLFSAAMYLIMYFMHITNPWIYLVVLFIATLGAGLFNLMVWSFITDVIDYHQYVTGDREDGTVYGVNSFARKVGQALAGAVGGFMLQLIGYHESAVGGVIQTAVVRDRIYAMANLVPVVCLVIAAVTLLIGYPLTKSKTIKMGEELKKINEGN